MKKNIFISIVCFLMIFGFSMCSKSLHVQDVNKTTDELYSNWVKQYKTGNQEIWNNKEIIKGDLRMKFDYKIFGEAPSDGRSLYISLHGGGNTRPEVNDKQWQNQIKLYKPEEGLVIAPRAPWDDWNMWFRPEIDGFFDDLIHLAIAMENVNPDKVYLLGYSAGGDGLYRMAPRMADRWAASSMMAGHPGDASQVNLRNLPFMIWMGEKDGAYDRNKWAATIGQRLDSLQANDPAGYIHETHIVKDKGHWMELADAAAIPWMAKYERNPYPDRIVWLQEKVIHPFFYWLGVSKDEAKAGMKAVVTRSGNTITILENDYNELTVFLNDKMFDLNKPVIVKYRGKEIFNKKVARSIYNIEKNLNDRKDVRYMFPAKLVVENNSGVK
ncbi:MAG: alpha/beta hydrolase [Dysgonomonas sp.]|nr:alpha/beta hydrolase [Dysgonomonas sp.]